MFHFYILSLDGIRRWLRAEQWYADRKIHNSEELREIIKEVVIKLWHPREPREFGAKQWGKWKEGRRKLKSE